MDNENVTEEMKVEIAKRLKQRFNREMEFNVLDTEISDAWKDGLIVQIFLTSKARRMLCYFDGVRSLRTICRD